MPDLKFTIAIEKCADFAAIGSRWRALEADADGGFFRSWTYLGCLGAERFEGASLLAVRDGAGMDVALAMLGRRGQALFLNETGDPVRDSVFIEHNGLLFRRGTENRAAAAYRRAAQAGASVVLSGIGDGELQSARQAGWVTLKQSRFAPAVDLARLRQPFIETLSANARAQIRRAQRLYGDGLTVTRAAGVGQALEFFERLMAMHTATWRLRGKPGAFASADIVRFHQALIARAVPYGQADLLRIGTSERAIGYLYNFIDRPDGGGRVLSYQSGFPYSRDAREKPGLVSHALAIGMYGAEGRHLYDMLGGADRYKTTLAQGGSTLHWAVLRRRTSLRGIAESLAGRFRAPPASGHGADRNP